VSVALAEIPEPDNRSALTIAVDELISAGEVDPHVIASTLREREGTVWTLRAMMDHDIAFMANFARLRLTQVRRASRVHHTIPEIGPVEPSTFVPEWTHGGWKRDSDLTEADCLWVAAHYEKLERACQRESRRYREFARLIKAFGVETLGEVPVSEVEAVSDASEQGELDLG
jgi:hypothetical protein